MLPGPESSFLKSFVKYFHKGFNTKLQVNSLKFTWRKSPLVDSIEHIHHPWPLLLPLRTSIPFWRLRGCLKYPIEQYLSKWVHLPGIFKFQGRLTFKKTYLRKTLTWRGQHLQLFSSSILETCHQLAPIDGAIVIEIKLFERTLCLIPQLVRFCLFVCGKSQPMGVKQDIYLGCYQSRGGGWPTNPNLPMVAVFFWLGTILFFFRTS